MRRAEKKVLIEETPTLDTYETRRRARLIIGTLSVACVLLFGWIVYRAFFPTPSGSRSPPPATRRRLRRALEVRPSLDQEARVHVQPGARVRQERPERPGRGHVESVVKVYKGTPTAGESKAALERAGRTCRCSAIGPWSWRSPKNASPHPAPPPAVVTATPALPQAGQGQAALVLPANPAEVVVAPRVLIPARNASGRIAHRSLPPGFQASPDAGIHESGWPLVIVGDRDGAPMVLVPGGTFTMGNNEGQPAEAPEHQVRLPTYYIDQHEVTNRQFRIFLGESHYRGKPAGKWLTDDKARAEPDDLPVVHVNFHDAEAVRHLGRQANPDRGAMGNGSAVDRWPAVSLGRRASQVVPAPSVPPDRSGHDVHRRQVALRGLRHGGQRPGVDQRLCLNTDITTISRRRSPTIRPGRRRSPASAHRSTSVRGGAKNWSVTYREGVPADRRLPYLGFRCVLVVESQAPAPPAANPAAPPGAPAAHPASTPRLLPSEGTAPDVEP